MDIIEHCKNSNDSDEPSMLLDTHLECLVKGASKVSFPFASYFGNGPEYPFKKLTIVY